MSDRQKTSRAARATSPGTPYRSRPRHIRPHLRFVALFDVLGFKQRLANEGVLGLTHDYIKLLRVADLWITGHANLFAYEPKGNRMGYAVFSDTILVWSHRLDHQRGEVLNLGYVSIFFDTCNLLLAHGAAFLSYMRAGIAYGEVIINPRASLFIGQPIVDAYLTEQRQDWIGGACHESCESSESFSSVAGSWGDVVPYEIPLHSGARSNGYAMNWCRHLSGLENPRFQIDLLSTVDLSVQRKLHNTNQFWQSMRSR